MNDGQHHIKPESRYRSILENMQDAFFQADISGLFTFANPSAARMYGYSMEELIGMPAASLYADPDERVKLLKTLQTSGILNDYSVRGLRKDGTSFWVSMNVQLLKDSNGKVTGTEGIVRDITERKLVEEALQIERNNITAIFESSPVAMIVIDESTSIIRANSAAINLCGGDKSNVIHHRPGEALHCSKSYEAGCGYGPDCPLCPVRRGIENLIAGTGGQIDKAEIQLSIMCDKKERQIWLEVSAAKMLIDEKNAACISLIDINSRKETDKALKKALREYQEAGEMAHVGHWTFDPVSQIFKGSPESLRIYGFPLNESAPFTEIATLISPSEVDRVVQSLFTLVETGKKFDEKFEIYPKNSTEPRFLWSVAEMEEDAESGLRVVTGILQDISELRNAEIEKQTLQEQLHQSQKMESIGQLAGGVAHDFNNMLSIIIGYGEMVLDQLKEGDPLRNKVQEIINVSFS